MPLIDLFRTYLPATVALALAALQPAAAQTPASAVIVLDGSGSMGGPLEGQKDVKWDMAVTAIRQALSSLKPDARLGLVTFGNRRRGDCSDIDVVVPPAAGTRDQVLAPFTRIGPTGKGPLTLALREAAKSLGPAATGALILIHDDPDNCRQDACAAAADIAKTSPKLAVHVVTINLDKTAAASMACVAKATGGRHFEARDTAGVVSAVNEAFRLANLATGTEPPPEEAKPSPQASAPEAGASEGPPRLSLEAALAANGPRLEKLIRWRLRRADENGEIVAERSAPTFVSPLEPGRYYVEAQYGHVTARQNVEVNAKGETKARMALNAGVLTATVRSSKTESSLGEPVVVVSAKRSGDEKAAAPLAIERQADLELTLPAGTYVVEARDGLALKTQEVTLAAGARAAAELVLGTGRIELSAQNKQGGETLDGTTYIVSVDDPDAEQGRREVARSAAPRPEFVLPAGTYYVTGRLGQVEARDRIGVGTGDIIKHSIVLPGARVSLLATYDTSLVGSDAPIVFHIFDGDKDPREVTRYDGASGEVFLAQGRYKVVAQLGNSFLKANSPLEVQAGESTKVSVKLDAGEVRVQAPGAGGGPVGDLHWDIRDPQGHVAYRPSPSGAKPTLLSPGRYVLRYERAERPGELPFELKPGERKVLDLGPH